MFGLSFLVIIALASLVWFTGLGIQSPFVPMAAAPAVFGPFIASNRRTVAVLLAFVIVVLIVITAVAPVSECGIKKCHDAAKHHPDRWAFCAVTAVFLLIAGSISALRLRRDRELSERDLAQRNAELEKENREHELSERDLAQRNAKLEKENRALRARLGDA